MKDLYYILGQPINATPGELNAAYRKLAHKLRPDGQEADPFLENHFNDIVEAYQVLSDPDHRRKYDTALKRSHKRRLYWFKLSYLSVAAVLTLIGFTSLFGYYVIKMVSGNVKAKPNIVVKAEAVAVPPPKHHKRKHRAISTFAAAAKVGDKPAVFTKAPVIKTDTAKIQPVKPAIAPGNNKPDLIAKAPVINKPAPPANVTVTAYLQANTTGVVSLHQLATYQSAILTYIPNHSEVQVLEKGAAFCKVSFQNQTGYVPKWTIPD